MPTPIVAPDGTVRLIPDEQVDDALNAGGRHAVKVFDPKGTARWIPEDNVQDALAAGGKLPDDRGPLKSFADTTGISNVTPSDLIGIALPQEAASRAARGLIEEGKRVYGEVKQGMNSPDFTEQQKHFTAAVPFVGAGIQASGEQAQQGNYAGAAGSFAGVLANMFGMEAGEAAMGKVAPKISSSVPSASAIKDEIYPEATTQSAQQINARKLAKALTVQVQAMPNFVGAATEEAGTILDYARKNGIKINSTVDLANAAKGAADAVQGHFDKAILEPNARIEVSVPSDYRGVKLNVEGRRATIGEINNRINAINQEMSPNYRKATAMQTNAANVSDADLLAEKRKITGILHDQLADATGLEPEDIAALRRKAGKLRTLADEAMYSANTNTNAAGKAAMGGTDLPAATKMGIVERGIQTLRGGPEIIGNRMVRRAVRDVTPTELVLPNPRVNPTVSPLDNPVQNQAVAPPPNPNTAAGWLEQIAAKQRAVRNK